MKYIDADIFKMQLRNTWGKGSPLHIYLHPDTFENIHQGGYALRMYSAPSDVETALAEVDAYYHQTESIQPGKLLAVNLSTGDCLEYLRDS